MTRFLLAPITLAVLTGYSGLGTSKPDPIQGVWQVVEVTTTGPGAMTMQLPEPRGNLTIITANHYSRVEVHADARQQPADLSKATADELRAVWGTLFAEAGTYTTDGKIMTMRPIVAKNPSAMASGAFTTFSYKLDGNTIVVTGERNQNGPVSNPATVKAIRLE